MTKTRINKYCFKYSIPSVFGKNTIFYQSEALEGITDSTHPSVILSHIMKAIKDHIAKEYGRLVLENQIDILLLSLVDMQYVELSNIEDRIRELLLQAIKDTQPCT